MATLVLQAAGGALGSMLGPVGAIVGRAAGALAGSIVDQSLFGTARHVPQPHLTSLRGVTSTEGTPIPRVYGRARVGGQMIWATRFLEVGTASRAGGLGGKGMGGGAQQTSYAYYANFAIGLCEGPIAGLRRVWADGREIDLTLVTMRLYRGDELQSADPLIVAKEGAQNVPAYRGLAYVVFENLPLAPYGNRVPQFTFEVVRPVAGLAQQIQAVNLIPGASEYGYSPTAYTQSLGMGVSQSESRHQYYAASDWTASLDALQAICPNLKTVALVVSWFGDDLRAGHCTIAPRVDSQVKQVIGAFWCVAGLGRTDARLVSSHAGAPAYGGTPSDDVVIAAIRDLRARGLSVVFYPFVMMDVPEGNALPDPWTGSASQPAYPWRGRITCDPARGQPGSADGTSEAARQIASFFGSQAPAAGEWSYRACILHYARLCQEAGGVSAFLLGSEFVGLTHVCAAPGLYPAADALVALAADVKAIIGSATKVSYAADWTEYGADVRAAGAEVRFPLDEVWASPNVDFIGMDAYFPLSDWRDGTGHADAALASSVYDRTYLASRVNSGEAYDWYYADEAGRAAQTRLPITDTTYGKPWIFRQKDLAGWWSNPHFERVGGVELARPTAFVPQGKPIWLTETGCPAVDRGANAPNCFPDYKASSASLPPFSRGFRDDLMQTRALESVIGHFDSASPLSSAGANPVSSVYGGPMVDPGHIHVWAWDARPFPAFPLLATVWADAADWQTGHWLNGRLEGAPLDRLVQQIVGEMADVAIDLPPLDGFVEGFVVDRLMSPRGALQQLAGLFGFDATASGGRLTFVDRTSRPVRSLTEDDLVPDKQGRPVTFTRAQESELPKSLSVSFCEGAVDYRTANALSRQLAAGAGRDTRTETAVVTSRAEAQRLADMWLQDLWVGRERADFTVRPGLVDLELGDAVTFDTSPAARMYRIDRIADGSSRVMSARAVDPGVYDHAPPAMPAPFVAPPAMPGPPHVEILDLALADGDPSTLQYAAACAEPWPGALAFWQAKGAAYEFVTSVSQTAAVGVTLSDFGPGPLARYDRGNSLMVRMTSGVLSSADEIAVLGGANRLALKGPDGACEIVAFRQAQLVAADTWLLSLFLRGLGGEDALASRTLAAGATVVVIDKTLVPLATGQSGIGISTNWRVGPASRDYSDPSFVGFSATPGPKALMPYSPVRVTATRGPQGIVFAFVRRGRLDSDAWEPIDIPLAEASEAYALDIVSSGQVVRTLAGNVPSILYAAGDELSDFGAPQSALDISLCQMSAAVGRGFPFVGRLTIR